MSSIVGHVLSRRLATYTMYLHVVSHLNHTARVSVVNGGALIANICEHCQYIMHHPTSFHVPLCAHDKGIWLLITVALATLCKYRTKTIYRPKW